jgi:molecular chaperone DnaJ
VAAKRDYYEVLGIERGADENAVKTAYRKLALQYHPDRNPGDAAAEAKFKEATEAYEVLKDSERRARYDRFGHEAAAAGMPGGMGGVGFDNFDLADALRAFMRDFGGGGGGGFEDLFGGGGGGGEGAMRRGNDLRVRLKLSLEEVATGVKKTIQVKRQVTCETCEGSGAQKGGKSTCATCGGQGRVRQVRSSLFGQFVNIGPCPKCKGTGSIIEKSRRSPWTSPPASPRATTSRCAGSATPAPTAGRPATCRSTSRRRSTTSSSATGTTSTSTCRWR